MTTLASILQSASAGLNVAQTGINTVSTNVANINTPGYVREIVEQNTLASSGLTSGVSVSGVVRAANQYLQNASLAASGTAGQASAVSSMLAQAQALFGDPTSTSSFFNQLNTVFSDFSSAALDPTSGLSGQQTIDDVNQFLSQAQSINSSLNSLSGSIDDSVSNDVDQANQLLSQISALNVQITATTSANGQAANLQNSQSALIDQLSSLMGIKVASTPTGGVTVTTNGGTQLVGQYGAATLGYTTGANGLGQVTATSVTSDQQPEPLTVTSGDMGGLLSLRNSQIPGLQSQLSEFVTQSVNAINQASNASSSVPPPAQLNGSNIGLDLPTAISGFTGTSTIAVVNSSGMLQHSVAIDFGAKTISVDGGTPTNFTASSFLSTLQTAMTSVGGSASFSNGALSLSTGTTGTGLAIQDNAASANGQGFSQYFGLNDLITSGSQITNYNTGLTAASANNFVAGGTISLGINDANGDPITTVSVAMPSGGTMQNVLNALNSSTSGVGLYGQFTLSSSGALTFNPSATGTGVTVNTDKTQWGSGGTALSQLFGLGSNIQSGRTASFAVRSDISGNPNLLQTATLDLSAATSHQAVLTTGDNSGMQRLAQAGTTTQNFAAAGLGAATSATVTQYAAQFAGAIANAASAATQANTSATSLQSEAEAQRQSVEGVNLDQELVNLTTYQQAYSASARLVTAAQDMFQALITMVGQ